MINEGRVVDEFLELVQIDSESKYEREISDILQKKFLNLGLDVVEDNSAKDTGYGSGNLICTLKGSKKDVTPVFFACHMDTVVPGVGVQPFIKDGCVHSSGTTILGADDKAGIAAMLEGIRVLSENNIAHGDLQFIITVGEEAGLIGAKALDMTKVYAEYGYALDSDYKVGTAFICGASQLYLEMKFQGKAAHGGSPEKGISAVVMAANAISAMPHGRIDSETTANIGIISGGRETNIVCEEVVVEAEVRSLIPEKMEKQANKMFEAAQKVAKDMGGEVELKKELLYSGFSYKEDDELVKVFCEATEKCGRNYKLASTVGGSDANIFNSNNLPTIILSVGYEEIHTKRERMPIAELVKLSELVVALAEEIK